MGASRTNATGQHRGRVPLTDDERLWLIAYAQRVGYAEVAERIDVDVRTLYRLAAGAGGTRGSVALVRSAIAREGNR
jgi:hypothetical protein